MSRLNNIQIVRRGIESINKTPFETRNISNTKKRVLLLANLRPNNGQLRLKVEARGSDYKLLLLDSSFKYIRTIKSSSEVFLTRLISRSYHLGATLEPGSRLTISSIDIKNSREDYINSLIDSMNGDTLLITPGYPSKDNLYSHAFIHSRVLAYEKNGLKNIDVVVVNEDNIDSVSSYTVDGVTVHNFGYNEARLLLQKRLYSKILVHFFNPKYAQILDASDMSQTNIFIYTHGGDVLYRDYEALGREYFKSKPEVTSKLAKIFDTKDACLKKYNSMPNVHWVFATDWCKLRAEGFLGESFNRSHIISNPISSSIFKYTERSPEHRKVITVVRPFNKLSSYSVDISIRTILELSKRPFFSELEFNIYGTGETHSLLTNPVSKFDNVKIHKTFLSSNDLSAAFANSGIVLMPTRYDSQAVAACEAAMTGAVVISSDGDIGLKECVDPSLGTFCETENFKAYADKIEYFYNNEDAFLETSKKMHAFTMSVCGEHNAINKDIQLLKDTLDYNVDISIKSKESKPTLTVAIPSYNVGNYLKNGVLSLINHKLAHKLEILIISDGSKDNTVEIGKQLEQITATKNGPIVRMIDKENGGHGSTINKGIELATGKYFKLMDGDDYFITGEFVKLIKILEKEDSDIILTNYIEDFSIDGYKNVVRHYDFMTPGLHYDLDVMQYKGYGFADWGPLLSTTTVKTRVLKDANFKIDENAFYVDMEYNFIIYAMSKTAVYYPLDIYNYYLGRAGQSISRESFTKNYLHHEKVTLRLLEEYTERYEHISKGKREYLVNKIIKPMCKSQYMITLDYHKPIGPFKSFDSKLKAYPYFYNNHDIASKMIRLHRKSLGITKRAHRPLRLTAQLVKNKVRKFGL